MVIKGNFLAWNLKNVIQTFSAIVFSIVCIYLLIFSDIPKGSEKYLELLMATLVFLVIAIFFYRFLASEYYYYELKPDRIIVRNLLWPYYRELAVDSLGFVNLYGNLKTPKMHSLKIEFIYQYNDSEKNFSFESINFDRHDWIKLIQELRKLSIDVRDPKGKILKHIDR